MELFPLVRQGKADKLLAFLQENKTININVKNEKGQTPLYWACERKSPDIATILIDHGANLEETEQFGFTPLHLTSFIGNEEILKVLLAKGANVNARTKSGATSLHLAGKNGHTAVVHRLLAAGANAEVADEKGLLPADVCPPDLRGVFPLRSAAVLQQLLQESQQLVTQLQRAQRCAACGNAGKDVVVVPCMHLLYCFPCVHQRSDCPACLRPIEGLIRCNMTL